MSERFTVNDRPLTVTLKKHIGTAYKGVTREQRGRAWVATGNDPALFDAENPEGPEDGHTFRIRVESRMSSSVEGEPRHTDADYFDEHGPGVEVRAWNLPDALRKAADLPFGVWTAGE